MTGVKPFVTICKHALCCKNGIYARQPCNGCCKPSSFAARYYHLDLCGRARLFHSQCDMTQLGLHAMMVAKKQDRQL